jgi:large subunit ribosomal protein L13
MKTFSQKPAEVTRKWYVIDASEATLGRVSTVASRLLIGKDKPTVTPHVDGGDFVVVVNADKLKVTGNKMQDKVYYRHSGHPGNLRARRLEEQMALDPTKVIEKAVYGMIPVNKLRDGRMKRLKVYAGSQHEHDAQKPETLSLKESK